MTEVRFRPLPVWPYPPTRQRRSRYTFKAGWDNTLRVLRREIAQIAVPGTVIVIGAGFQERDIRQDGYPRSGARSPAHPGVEISFDALIGQVGTRQQRLVYATDVCEHWQHNVRSLALGLEALRAVDRYGITRHGEQYAGFAALPPGAPTVERGLTLIRDHGGVKDALFATHPDHGGDEFDFACVQAARADPARVLACLHRDAGIA